MENLSCHQLISKTFLFTFLRHNALVTLVAVSKKNTKEVHVVCSRAFSFELIILTSAVFSSQGLKVFSRTSNKVKQPSFEWSLYVSIECTVILLDCH